ncbi:hypothetical protein [Novosphingobium sp. Gsoil 351]|uniref:hypothetical protein n=1 Tax=Novosphingobium sp. Gsoil 351 TaxID=2675225 RepID=UPI0018A83110|nr:hypothetical protein [Novosphingobium sp. Gsoil 351]
MRNSWVITIAVLGLGMGSGVEPASAQSAALLLFDGEKGEQFAGCLNCGRYDQASVCNRYGDYGSRYSSKSIWNRYGDFGSRYATNSPWSRYGAGLRVVDPKGNYYGRFSLSSYGQSKLPIVRALLAAYEADDDLEKLRDALCDS